MSLRDVGSALGIGGALAFVADFAINGGDALIVLISFILDQNGLIYLLMSRLSAAAPEIGWLPAGLLNKLTVALALLSATIALFRLAKTLTERYDS